MVALVGRASTNPIIEKAIREKLKDIGELTKTQIAEVLYR
jgi:hypothetical protein